MRLNLKKCEVLNIKGNSKIVLGGLTVEEPDHEKDLGIIVSRELTWSHNADRRCDKATKAFFTVKRNIAVGTRWQIKKNLYKLHNPNYLIRCNFVESQ